MYKTNTYIPTGSTSGDPHVFPMKGEPFELPMKAATYRMVQGKNLVVNASTRKMTRKEGREVVTYYKKHFPGSETDVLTDGYFYNKLYIHNEDGYLVYDFDSDNIECSHQLMYTSKVRDADKGQLNKYEKDVFVRERVLSVYNNYHGVTDIVLRHFTNPYLKHGFALNMKNIKNVSGLLLRESSARHMEVKSIQDTEKVTEVMKRNKKYTSLK